MARMAYRPGPVVGLVLALVFSFALGSSGPAAVPDVAAAGLPAWHGGIDLYRKGTFTTQRSWLWCTAADVQIIRNIVRHQKDHTTANQRLYFDWMRRHNRYSLPLSAGVDPAGWTAGLRHFVDNRYRLVASRTFEAALKSAVTNLRRTNLPVGITVANGGHAWILTGFTATADPLKTSKFTVTSVRVVGPLFGLQSRNGYDMPPDTKLTPAQFRHFFTPWKYAPKPMIWDGRYVSIQPIPAKAASTAPTATPRPSAAATSAPPSPAASASGLATASPLSTAATPDPAAEVAVAQPSAGAAVAPATVPTDSGGPGAAMGLAILAIVLAGVVMAVGIGRSVRRSQVPPLGRRPTGRQRRPTYRPRS
jgi:hypothetical protein